MSRHDNGPLNSSKRSNDSDIYNEEDQFGDNVNEPAQQHHPPNINSHHSLKKGLQDHLQEGRDSVRRVDSQEQIQPARNLDSSANNQRNSGIVIRVIYLESEENLTAKLKILIHNEGSNGSGASTRQTKVVTKEALQYKQGVAQPVATWNQDLYYNNSVLNDNFTFVLRGENNKEYAKTETINLSDLRKYGLQQEGQVGCYLKYLELLDKEPIAKLRIEVSFYQCEDILGGVIMPNLSLKPPKGFVAQYTPVNAIDSYRSKKFGKEPGSRANCFNFYDADQLPDLESIGMFPPKIKRKNKVIKAEQS